MNSVVKLREIRVCPPDAYKPSTNDKIHDMFSKHTYLDRFQETNLRCNLIFTLNYCRNDVADYKNVSFGCESSVHKNLKK